MAGAVESRSERAARRGAQMDGQKLRSVVAEVLARMLEVLRLGQPPSSPQRRELDACEQMVDITPNYTP